MSASDDDTKEQAKAGRSSSRKSVAAAAEADPEETSSQDSPETKLLKEKESYKNKIVVVSFYMFFGTGKRKKMFPLVYLCKSIREIDNPDGPDWKTFFCMTPLFALKKELTEIHKCEEITTVKDAALVLNDQDYYYNPQLQADLIRYVGDLPRNMAIWPEKTSTKITLKMKKAAFIQTAKRVCLDYLKVST